MARRAKAAAAKPNTANPEVVNSILNRWDEIQDQRESDLGTYRSKCKQYKQDEADLLTEAKSRGVDPKLLKTDIRVRRLRNQIAEIVTNIEGDQEADWEAIVMATAARLGGKPLDDGERAPAQPTVAQRAKAETKAKAKGAIEDFENMH